MSNEHNTLVVCTAGQQRSPTAKRLLEDEFSIPARSAGIDPQASPQVTQKHIDWSDYVIAMDERTDGHKSFLEQNFDLGNRPVFVFDIPDMYNRNNSELVSILKDKLPVFVEQIKDV